MFSAPSGGKLRRDLIRRSRAQRENGGTPTTLAVLDPWTPWACARIGTGFMRGVVAGNRKAVGDWW